MVKCLTIVSEADSILSEVRGRNDCEDNQKENYNKRSRF
jgi:hypothetical protein